MPTMSTNFSPSKMSTSTRSPALTAAASSAFSTSIGTSRRNRTGGKLCLPRCPFMGWVKRDSFMNSTRPIWAASYPSRVWVLCCVITHGPACKTVAGCTSPLSSKSCVIPTFLPRIPVTFAISILLRELYQLKLTAERRRLLVFLAKSFDLDVHTSGQVEFHQSIHSLLRSEEHIEQALVSADLKLLARLLVHVRGTQHAVLVFHRWQWNRARDLCPGAPRRIDNLTRGLVQDEIVDTARRTGAQ